jgi:PQQ-like domain
MFYHVILCSTLRGLSGGLGSALFYFFVLLLCPAKGMAADSWPEFRGPGAQGISTATNVPVSWSATSNITWKVAVPGRGWSSPVLADGKIYLSTCRVVFKPGLFCS